MMLGLCIVFVGGLRADVLHTVDFEVDGAGYTQSDDWNPQASDYFTRIPSGATLVDGFEDFSGVSGAFFAIEDSDNLPATPNITTTAIDISAGYTSFTTTVSIAATGTQESPDFVNFLYSFNGTDYTLFGSLRGLDPITSSDLHVDADFDGLGDVSGQAASGAFSDFSFNFTGSGSQLFVRTEVFISSNEELGIDDIRVSAAIPEPTTIGLMGLTSLGVFIFRRKRYRKFKVNSTEMDF